MFRGPAAVFVVSWSAGSWLLKLPLAGSTAVAALLALAFSHAGSPRSLNSAFARAVGPERRIAWEPVLRDVLPRLAARSERPAADLFALRPGRSRTARDGDHRVPGPSRIPEAPPERTRPPR